jgi:hypothetical protein
VDGRPQLEIVRHRRIRLETNFRHALVESQGDPLVFLTDYLEKIFSFSVGNRT